MPATRLNPHRALGGAVRRSRLRRVHQRAADLLRRRRRQRIHRRPSHLERYGRHGSAQPSGVPGRRRKAASGRLPASHRRARPPLHRLQLSTAFTCHTEGASVRSISNPSEQDNAAMPTQLVQAVLFDLDGTLIDSTASVNRNWRIVADLMGRPAEDVVGRFHGMPGAKRCGSLIRPCPITRSPFSTRC